MYYNLNIFGYLPRRQTSNRAGSITKYKLLISEDGSNFTEVAQGTWDGKDYHYKTVEFTPIAGRYVRLVAEETCDKAGTVGAGDFACINEIDVGGRLIRPTLDPVAIQDGKPVPARPSSAPLAFRVFGNNAYAPQQLPKHITSVGVYNLSGRHITDAVVKNGIITFKKQVAKSNNLYIIRINRKK